MNKGRQCSRETKRGALPSVVARSLIVTLAPPPPPPPPAGAGGFVPHSAWAECAHVRIRMRTLTQEGATEPFRSEIAEADAEGDLDPTEESPPTRAHY